MQIKGEVTTTLNVVFLLHSSTVIFEHNLLTRWRICPTLAQVTILLPSIKSPATATIPEEPLPLPPYCKNSMATILGKSLILPFQVLFPEALCLNDIIYNNVNLIFYGGSRMAHGILLVKVIMLDGLCTEYTHNKKQVSFCLYLVCRYVSCY